MGWREWVGLPSFGVDKIKVKVDSGARTSALHVSHLKVKGRKLTFRIHPDQNDADPFVEVAAHVYEYRWIKSSNGIRDKRPVIRTSLKIGEDEHTIELTLVNRDLMGFRMLLGREAVRNKFLINPGRSFLIGKKKSLF